MEEDRLTQDRVSTSLFNVKLWEGETFGRMGLLINTDTFLSNWLLVVDGVMELVVLSALSTLQS